MRVLTLLLVVGAASAKYEQYTGWKTFGVTPTDQEQLKFLGKLRTDYDLDFISHATVNHEGIVLVNPKLQEILAMAFESQGIKYRIHRDDLQAALEYDDELIETTRINNMARNGREFPYDNYQRYDVILAYLEDVASRYPNMTTLVTANETTFEGRSIKYLKISSTNFEDKSKPVIFIDAGIHAREWIAPPTVTYAIQQLVESNDTELLERFDWILLPVVNPDGYEFSFGNGSTIHRFWRKTRAIDAHPESPNCPGVDGNRNFDFFWNTVGHSSYPCDENYLGLRPFSEVETRVVRDIIQENLQRMALYLTMHSFGSMILYPWGHDGSLSINSFALHTVGVVMAEQINQYALPEFSRYVVGNSALVLGYPMSGASMDYAHQEGVPLSFIIELPGRSQGLQGFNLPPYYIKQVCVETWAAIAEGAKMAGVLLPKMRKNYTKMNRELTSSQQIF